MMLNRKSFSTVATLITIMLITGLALAASHNDAPCLPKDLHEYRHVNTLFVIDAESPIHGIHHFYMGEEGREIFMKGGSDEYPNGTTFIGKVYKPVKTDEGRYKEGALAAYTMMKKDASAKAAQDTGGWYFAMFSPDGHNKNVDPVNTCFDCHKPSPDTDFVLSEPLK